MHRDVPVLLPMLLANDRTALAFQITKVALQKKWKWRTRTKGSISEEQPGRPIPDYRNYRQVAS